MASNLYCIRTKPVATPNASPGAEGSGDYYDTLVTIKSLKTNALSHTVEVPIERKTFPHPLNQQSEYKIFSMS